ncbi:17391_t:CDS:1, partial [Racocetra fulgida]
TASTNDFRLMLVISLANDTYEWINSNGTIPLIQNPNESPPPQNGTKHN